MRKPGANPSADGNLVYPGAHGGINWWSPSFSPDTGLLYAAVLEWGGIYFQAGAEFRLGRRFLGGNHHFLPPASATTSLKAIEPQTGTVRWEERWRGASPTAIMAGVLSTAGGLVFTANHEGRFLALDARLGGELWGMNLGGDVLAAPISYAVGGRQHVAIAAGRAIYSFTVGGTEKDNVLAEAIGTPAGDRP